MKRMRLKLQVLAAVLSFALCLVSLSGCNEPEEGGHRAVESIRFGARANAGETKTVYAGNSGSVERIDWESGDRVTVISPLAKVYDKTTNPYGVKYSHTNPNYSEAEYRITTVAVGSSGLVSDAALDNYSDSNGLLWDQAGKYDFVAMYPSASFSPENSGVSLEWTSSGSGKLSAVIPKEQKPRAGSSPTTTSRDTTRVWPDMRYAYMYAGAQVNLTSTAAANPLVSLDFYPMVTTFRFTVKADDATREVGIARLEMVSPSCALAASYTAEISTPATSGSATYTVPSLAAGVTDTVRFQLPLDGSGNPTVKVTSSKRAVITLFAVPKGISYKVPKTDGSTTMTDLTLRFSLVIDGKKVGRSLDLRPADPSGYPKDNITLSAKNFVEFPAGKKVNISGLTLPSQLDPWRFTVDAADLENENSDVVVNPVRMREWDEVDGGRLDQKNYTVTLPDTLEVARGTFLPLTVTVTDSDANTVTPANVTWNTASLDLSMATLSPVAGTSATVTGLEIGTAGTVTASVTIAGTTYTSAPCTIIVTATAGSTSAYDWQDVNPGLK